MGRHTALVQDRSCGRYDRCVIHSSETLQGRNDLRHSGTFLTNGHVDALNVSILLIDDSVYSNCGFTRLAIADDQFPLSATDGDHGINGFDTGLQRFFHRFSFDYSGGDNLDNPEFR